MRPVRKFTWPSLRGWPTGTSPASRANDVQRSADIELLGPPERLRSNFFNGIKRLPVRVTQ